MTPLAPHQQETSQALPAELQPLAKGVILDDEESSGIEEYGR